MSITGYLSQKISRIYLEKGDKLYILQELTRIDREFDSLLAELVVTKKELEAIRKMHETKYIMPFFDEDSMPANEIHMAPNNRYDMTLAVQGEVDYNEEQQVVALSVEEKGFRENIKHKVWINKALLFDAKDRVGFVKHVLEKMFADIEYRFIEKYRV